MGDNVGEETREHAIPIECADSFRLSDDGIAPLTFEGSGPLAFLKPEKKPIRCDITVRKDALGMAILGDVLHVRGFQRFDGKYRVTLVEEVDEHHVRIEGIAPLPEDKADA